MGNKWTVPELIALSGTLPMVSSSDGVLKLEGQGSIFNPAPPMNLKWLKGVISSQEFVNIVEGLNKLTIPVHAGQYHANTESNHSKVEAAKAEICREYIKQVNSYWNPKGVNWAYQLGQSQKYKDSKASGDYRYLSTKAVTYLYVSIDDDRQPS